MSDDESTSAAPTWIDWYIGKISNCFFVEIDPAYIGKKNSI